MIDESVFDSTIFGVRVGRAMLDRADAIEPILTFGRQAGFDVVFARARADAPVVTALSQRGLEPLETLVTLTWRDIPARPSSGSNVEHHSALGVEDAAAIADLTANAITVSHFHADRRLPLERTRLLYATWAKNDVTGRAHRTIVVRNQQRPAGYLAILLSQQTAIIDLFAVDPSQQGRGIGTVLLSSFLEWVRTEKLKARVGTQSTNPALQLYQRFGFVPSSRQVTYHLWLT